MTLKDLLRFLSLLAFCNEDALVVFKLEDKEYPITSATLRFISPVWDGEPSKESSFHPTMWLPSSSPLDGLHFVCDTVMVTEIRGG